MSNAGYPKSHDIGKFVIDSLKDDLESSLLEEMARMVVTFTANLTTNKSE